MDNKLKEKLKLLPTNFGCYLMKNNLNNIIYVGKAKNLKNRVLSYFSGRHDFKTTLLVNEIVDFEYIITNSESDAFILENQLIKTYKPKYNILLKDDKMYPYIAITNELYPRLILTRSPKKNIYYKIFGPYSNSSDARKTIDILNYIYPLRKCNKLPKKECLYYHIKQCVAPCIFKINKEEYHKYIQEIVVFLNGKTKKVFKYLEEKMYTCSSKMEYENALSYKNMITSLKSIFNIDNILNNIYENADFINFSYDDNYICIQIFHVRNGMIVKRDSDIFLFNGNLADTLETYILQFYTSKRNILPDIIYTNLKPFPRYKSMQDALGLKKIKDPKKGIKKKLLDLVKTNTDEDLLKKKIIAEKEYTQTIGAIKKLGELLNINYPYKIEMIDISNLSNQCIVGAVVVYINGRKSKKDYRKYKITTTKIQDDYKALEEIIYRRYSKILLEDKKKLPDLLIVDGGKGHVNIVKKSLDLMDLKINAIGLKKNSKHKTESIITLDYKNFFINNIDHNVKNLLINIQEEVHRFVINYHKNKRISSLFSSEIDQIAHIGEKTKNKILMQIDNIDDLKNMSEEDLRKIVNKKQAQNIYNFYHKK